jgi:hypothetical protein
MSISQPTVSVSPQTGSVQAASGTSSIGRSWKTGMVVALIMVVLALVGIGLATVRPAAARQYWMWLVPMYGVLCVATAWLRSRQDSALGVAAVVRQVFHWLGIGGAVAFDIYIRGGADETGVTAGFNALLLLAVGCFLAGVHLEWLFVPVGLLLALTLFCVVKAQQYLWMILLAGTLALAAVFIAMRAFGRSGGQRAS